MLPKNAIAAENFKLFSNSLNMQNTELQGELLHVIKAQLTIGA